MDGQPSVERVGKGEGIDAAKAKGPGSPFKGRPSSIDHARIAKLHLNGMGASSIAKELGIARSSVYRYLET